MASDNAFAAALLGLWHRVSAAGGWAEFEQTADRATIGPAVSEIIAALRSGRAVAFAATRQRDVVGFVLLEPGVRWSAHTAQLRLVLVDPDEQRGGIGSRLLQNVLALALANGHQLVRVTVPAGVVLEPFFERVGFVVSGRSAGWIRRAPGAERDEVMLVAALSGN